MPPFRPSPIRRAAFAGVAIALLALCAGCGSAAPGRAPLSPAPETIRLWPGQAPGTEGWTGPEEEADVALPNTGRIHVVTNISVPPLTVYRPVDGQANGTGMLVVPGGAFRALPWDLDGVETARWLTAHGITAFLLKYRVRPPEPTLPADRSFADFARRTETARALAIADAGQAMRLVRADPRRFGIAPHRLGMIGFSAGAMTTALLAASADPAVRPDFAAALYGAWLGQSDPTAAAAPLFVAAAQDDAELSASESVKLFTRWTGARAAAELHLYERGGHAFGFRPHKLPVDAWPEAFAAWLATRGYLPARTAVTTRR